jgi:hypothetical protein
MGAFIWLRWRIRLAAVDDEDLLARRMERCKKRSLGSRSLRMNIEDLRENFPLINEGFVKWMA